jgi:hypothetical protein
MFDIIKEQVAGAINDIDIDDVVLMAKDLCFDEDIKFDEAKAKVIVEKFINAGADAVEREICTP